MGLLYPLKFKPVYKDYPWGNTTLPARFGREEPDGVYAESWEVSTHPDGESIVVNGAWSGQPLSQVLRESGPEILGSAVEGNDFPLLIKLIDAAKPLSVQVHPNNQNAAKVQGDPKTEMWYFLNEEPAQIYCGLTPGVTRQDFVEAMAEEHFEDVLRKVSLRKGEAAYVPGGRVHAIDAGCLILEIQQRSNTTYRVYDWGRVGNDGKPRELHVDKALQVIDFEDAEDPVCQPERLAENVRRICVSPYFELDELTVSSEMKRTADGTTFHVLFSAEGPIEISYGDGLREPVARGTSVLIPAGLGPYSIHSESKITVLSAYVPVP